MTSTSSKTVSDGNHAVADVAYRINEICIIYPITPASQMGEAADQFSAAGKKNIWGIVPTVVEMQSEGGVCGAMHGALQTGALATTFSSSQGLLLMIPDMYHISAELSPTVFHIATRAVASQGMTIYSEHSDVMAVRTTGFGMLCSDSVQTAHDNALIAQLISLETRVPFVHFFDGLRVSHEVRNFERLSDEDLKALIDNDLIYAHRQRRLCSEKPVVRGVVQNSDIYFQGRESVNPYYEKTIEAAEKVMQKFKRRTGREYHSIEYIGHKKAERIIVIMGAAAETVRETVDYFVQKNEKIGFINIRLFQPFPTKLFLNSLPKTCRAIAALDRTKEPGAGGEPLYQKIASAVMNGFSEGFFKDSPPYVIGGRYGIAAKPFTPEIVKAVFDNLLSKHSKQDFIVGIKDDVTQSSLECDEHFDIEPDDVYRGIFYGLGADGTVGANKNSIKIIGEETKNFVQGYFAFDARKSGARTTSYLRISPRPIHSAYKTQSAHFIGCHQFHFLDRIDVLEHAKDGAVFLLNSPFPSEKVWQHLPRIIQEIVINKKLRFYVIDAYKVAKDCGLGNRINTIMQVCFFALSDLLSNERAIQKIKETVQETYKLKGEEVVAKNLNAIDQALENLHQVEVPKEASSKIKKTQLVPDNASDFMKKVISKMLIDRGDELPVSAVPSDGTYPLQSTRYEKHNVSFNVPEWVPDACIQCGRCSLVCPHSVIRVKQMDKSVLNGVPAAFKKAALKTDSTKQKQYALQVYLEDCTGCELCVNVCPMKGKAIRMVKKEPILLERERENIRFFETLPYQPISSVQLPSVNSSQFLRPYFEFSSACAGCGETPYVRLMSQLFGDRMIIANACGCSSVFGGNLPSIPWVKDEKGYGPAWSSSLFEDNAEFGLGFYLTEQKHRQVAEELLTSMSKDVEENLVRDILNAKQNSTKEIEMQRERIEKLKQQLSKSENPNAKALLSVADFFVKHSVWSIGGDGWAYDIGYSGLDHVIAGGYGVNFLVLDTEVYSNTGGQASKATPRGSVVKFAAQGKSTPKKDLGLIMMNYGTAYIAQIALGANPSQAIRAFIEAESFEGPSLIIAYSHCIAHGIDMAKGMEQQTLAVKSGYWPLYRYHPNLIKEGLNPFQLDSEPPAITLIDYIKNENRFKILARENPDSYEMLIKLAQQDVDLKWEKLKKLM